MSGSPERGQVAASKRRLVRIWPSISQCTFSSALLIGGVFAAINSVVEGRWFLAALGVGLVVIGARRMGWVEVDGEAITQRWVVGKTTTVRFADVREVGFGIGFRGDTKLWYPQVETLDGTSIRFSALESKSGAGVISHVETIFDAGPKREVAEDEFVTVTKVGDLELELTPGYDAYLRDKAKAEKDEPAKGLRTKTSSPIQTTAAVPRSRRHLRVVEDLAPDNSRGDLSETPEVFTPAPLQPRSVGVADKPKLVPPPVPIEEVRRAAFARYKRQLEAAETSDEIETQTEQPFVSLFSRAA